MAKKILVVDDERHIVRLIQVNLERSGYNVIPAYDGLEALEKVKSEKPDLIVTDDRMPRMDGFDFLKHLQNDSQLRDIPVLMLAEGARDADIIKGWASGVSSYYTKPLNPRTILVAIENIFTSLEGSPESDDDDSLVPAS